MLSIVYMGTPDFAVEPLKQLIEAGFYVKAVVTVPDKPAGRGQKLQQSAVKQFAIQNNLPVLQPTRLRDEEFLNELKTINADLFVVVAFRMLPELVWAMPPKGTINLHASLLPQYRGAAPINWAIINGEQSTGVTTFMISHEIDTGSILLQKEVAIKADETAGELHDDLMNVGAKLMVDTVKLLSEDKIKLVPQHEHIDLKPAPKLFKEDCRINWNDDVHRVYNLIRGVSPYPAAWSEIVSEKESIGVKIFKSRIEVEYHNYNAGKIISDGKTYLKVACANGFIFIDELQLSGKKRLYVKDLLLGFRNISDFIFL